VSATFPVQCELFNPSETYNIFLVTEIQPAPLYSILHRHIPLLCALLGCGLRFVVISRKYDAKRSTKLHQLYLYMSSNSKRTRGHLNILSPTATVSEPTRGGQVRKNLYAETQTTQRNQLVDQRVDQRPTQPTQWRTLLVSCPTQYYLEINGSR
jgi:hypothetical protein